VQLFYIASAMTLLLSWMARRSSERAPLRNYLLRRLFRILPMFWVAIALYVAIEGFGPRYWAPGGIRWWFIPLTASCLHGILPETANSVVPGGWSIAVEMGFYAVFPLLLKIHTTFARRVVLVIVSTVACLAFEASFPAWARDAYPTDQQYLVTQFAYLSLIGQLPVFALGLIVGAAQSWPAKWTRAIGALGTGGYCICRLIAPAGSRVEILLSHYLVVSLALACLALLMSQLEGSVLTNRFITLIGRISFSMYLLHLAVLEALGYVVGANGIIGDLAFFACYGTVVIVTALLSLVTYALIEQRGVLAGKVLIERLERDGPHPG
jgi:peptidoglycan/LPS O-acetylase OafA/YrhL